MATDESKQKEVEPRQVCNQLDASSQANYSATADVHQKPVAWGEHVVNFMWRESSLLSAEEKAVQQLLFLIIDPKGCVWDRKELALLVDDAIGFFTNGGKK